MNERRLLESAKEFALCLSELQGNLDPESYDLLLRILKGTNEALVNREAYIDIPFSEKDRELFTPAFGESLSRLLEKLGPLGMSTVVGIDTLTSGKPVGAGSTGEGLPPAGFAHLARQQQDMLDVEATARASGLEP